MGPAKFILLVAFCVLAFVGAAVAQRPANAPGSPPGVSAPGASAPGASAPGAPVAPPSGLQGSPRGPSAEALDGPLRWDNFPTMVLERVFRGPLRDTVIQRWRDPADNSICYIYVPMRAGVAAQGEQLVYGANTIGSLSCLAPGQILQLQVNGATQAGAAPAAPPQPAGQPPQPQPQPQAPQRPR